MSSLHYQSVDTSQLNDTWQQVSFTLTDPLQLTLASRFTWGGQLLAPWRLQGKKLDCLSLTQHQASSDGSPLILTDVGQVNLPTTDALLHQPHLLIGENLGIADVLFACQQLTQHQQQLLVLLKAEHFPCTLKPARFMVDSLPHAIAACPLLEDWGFANRLVHDSLPGCIDNSLDELKNHFSQYKQLHFC